MNALEGLRDFKGEWREIRALNSADDLALRVKEEIVLSSMTEISKSKTTME
jgi:hypothetical protein